MMGLGHVWAAGPHDRSRCRWEENVVMLPDNPEINEGTCSRLSCLKTEPNGSGVVGIDMNDVYATAGVAASGRRMPLYERYGNVRKAESFKDSGIRGMRSIGVDYSGRSGAPCLLAVVDRIEGGKSKLWMWHMEPVTGGDRTRPADAGDLSRTKVEGNAFTVAHEDGATLRGTFVTRHRLSAEVREASMVGGAASVAGRTLVLHLPGVYAEGGDVFFVVVTSVASSDRPVLPVLAAHVDRVRP
ncbi:MAG: hypothetical protein ABR915_04550 [Thermoguttaceae bacterium]